MHKTKKFLIFCLLFTILALLIAPVSAQNDVFVVTADVANVRTGYGIEFPIIGQVFQGSAFTILAYSPTANWVMLDLGAGRNGWVFVHLGEVSGSGNSTPIVVLNAPSNAGTSNNGTSNLGQGGGFPAPSTRSNQIAGTMTIEEFNSTVGVTASANMRRGPALGYGIVWIIAEGERAVPLARNANGTWILVNFEGHEGWVWFELIAAPPAIDLTALPVR